MSDGPEERNPIAPYYPSDVPHLPTTGRRWGALFLLLIMAFAFLLYVIRLVGQVV